MNSILVELKNAVIVTAALLVITCVVYPLTVWAAGQALFKDKANGSLRTHDGITLGSSLIGQSFAAAKYVHPRPSAAGNGYDAAASSGSNLGPLSKKLLDAVTDRVKVYREENGLAADALVPADAVTASGSGLDPHITPQNAHLQADRVAKERGIPVDRVESEIAKHTEGRSLGIFGDPRVNVFELNLALDGIQ